MVSRKTGSFCIKIDDESATYNREGSEIRRARASGWVGATKSRGENENVDVRQRARQIKLNKF